MITFRVFVVRDLTTRGMALADTLEFLISISGAWMAGGQQIWYLLVISAVSRYKAFLALGCVKVASSKRLRGPKMDGWDDG